MLDRSIFDCRINGRVLRNAYQKEKNQRLVDLRPMNVKDSVWLWSCCTVLHPARVSTHVCTEAVAAQPPLHKALLGATPLPSPLPPGVPATASRPLPRILDCAQRPPTRKSMHSSDGLIACPGTPLISCRVCVWQCAPLYSTAYKLHNVCRDIFCMCDR